MFTVLIRYINWLHTRWPAGTVEKLPEVRADGSTNIPGLYIVGDLTGIPLLKFSSDGGARAVQAIARDPGFQRSNGAAVEPGILDLVIVGAGVSGMAAALEARKAGLRYEIIEATEPFSTVVNFPKGKPIYTYPTDMKPAGDLQFTADVKEALVEELTAQTLEAGIKPRMARVERIARKGRVLEAVIPDQPSPLARRVIVAIGRSGNFRTLGIPGEEDKSKVFNRLHDPKEFAGKHVAVIGGGDSAIETAIAIAQYGGDVVLSYRKKEFSRPKPENVERLQALVADPMADVGVESPVSERVTAATGGFMEKFKKAGRIQLLMGSAPKAIAPDSITIADATGADRVIPNDAVFVMIGREAPLDFFRRSGVRVRGEGTPIGWAALILFFLFIVCLYDWKNHGFLERAIWHGWPLAERLSEKTISGLGDAWSGAVQDRQSFLGTLVISMRQRSFYYTLAYTVLVFAFGLQRIRRRRTPYVTVQTTVLILIQLFPLFLLPEIILPMMGYHGWFSAGWGKAIADRLFEPYISEASYLAQQWPAGSHPRAYWRAYGFILAWPLMIYNVFTDKPLGAWLGISVVQTCVLIPLLIRYYGKGAYCGWICSCGALAETLGDAHRHKMPHGARWNRLNLIGQAFLLIALLLLGMRVAGWIWPKSWVDRHFNLFFLGTDMKGALINPLSYRWFIDVLFAGILGVAFYFKYSGRVWCRFACPLAALMHIYGRFSRFRIVLEKKKCISCNVCTSVCHQGIDVMNFANKGMPMEDPECVRCSACVQSCPTGVLQFGQIDRKTGRTIKLDKLAASPVLMAEGK